MLYEELRGPVIDWGTIVDNGFARDLSTLIHALGLADAVNVPRSLTRQEAV